VKPRSTCLLVDFRHEGNGVVFGDPTNKGNIQDGKKGRKVVVYRKLSAQTKKAHIYEGRTAQ